MQAVETLVETLHPGDGRIRSGPVPRTEEVSTSEKYLGGGPTGWGRRVCAEPLGSWLVQVGGGRQPG